MLKKQLYLIRSNMKKIQPKVGIIGGGLAGVYTAYLLAQHNVTFEIIEAKPILGGRICGEDTNSPDYKIDLGPSWIFPHQQEIQKLVSNLGLRLVEQYSSGDAIFQRNAKEQPEKVSGIAPPTMYRIFGGTTRLITSLAQNINEQNTTLSTKANSFQYDGQYWNVEIENNNSPCGLQGNGRSTDIHDDLSTSTVLFEHLVIAAPPRVIAHKLSFRQTSGLTFKHQWGENTPSIHSDGQSEPMSGLNTNSVDTILEALSKKFEQTPTWMAAQAKFAVTYKAPFWREHGLSGQAFSHVGPLGEIHDASFEDNDGNSVFALFGFVGIPFVHRQQASIEQIKNACLSQLSSIFGPKASEHQQTYYKDWGSDPLIANSLDQKQRPMHPHIDLVSEQAQLKQLKLYFATSEFSESEAGYMEGAILTARQTVEKILLTVK
ncbi:MAG: monoamine oxidase [Gammaproteobacteria bacterium]|jgi:monoamine oxidase